MNRQEYENALRAFAEAVELEDLVPDEEGYCSLVFGEGLMVHFIYKEDEDQVEMFSSLGNVAEPRRASVALEMARANFAWQGTGGATLGMDDQGHVLMACALDGLAVTPEALGGVLASFGENAVIWSQRLASIDRGNSDGVGKDSMSGATMRV